MGKNILKSKKFRHGSLSVVFIAVFVAFVIGLNLIVSFLDTMYNLRFDLTESKIYTVSDEVDNALKLALGDKYTDFDVTITFCAERDLFSYYDSMRSDISSYYTSVRDLAEELSRIYDGSEGKGKVNIRYININTDPAAANQIKQQAALDTISWSKIIIQNNKDLNYFRAVEFDAFYASDDDAGVTGSNAEARYASSIIQVVSADNMTAAFTKGHGETHSAKLTSILELVPMNVIEIDLDDYKDGVPEDVTILVVSDPLRDFDNDEIKKISKFMSDKDTYNSMMVFVDADTIDLPNLREYLWEEWGLDYIPNNKVTDSEHSLANTEYTAVLGNFTTEENNIGYVLHKSASSMGLSAVFPNAVALKVDTESARKQTVSVSAYAYPTAVITADGESREAGKATPLIAISAVHTYANDDVNYNSNKYEYVMLVGSTGFVGGDYLTEAYANTDMMYTATRYMVTDRVSLDFKYKMFETAPLDLTSGTAKRLMLIVICAVPAVIIIAGIAIYLIRRHR